MKALLLRVGIDKGSGGCLAPIFEDGSFEYIPIPERQATNESRVYTDLFGRNGNPIIDFIPKKIHHSPPHFDPEFETFTYGDPTRNKSRQLAKLVPEDLLVFYAGLEPINKMNKPSLYIIGYFTVKQVYDFTKIPHKKQNTVLNKLQNNAHTKRKYLDEGLVIVQGNPENSRLLKLARPLGDNNDNISSDLKSIIGYSVNIRRAIGHWVYDEHFCKLKEYMR